MKTFYYRVMDGSSDDVIVSTEAETPIEARRLLEPHYTPHILVFYLETDPHEDQTKVLFRKYHNGDIIALFPEIPSDIGGRYCLSYEHVGQHGSANPRLVVRYTKPALPEEYAELAEELTNIGYNLMAVSRVSYTSDRNRHDTARRLSEYHSGPSQDSSGGN